MTHSNQLKEMHVVAQLKTKYVTEDIFPKQRVDNHYRDAIRNAFTGNCKG